MAGDQNKEFEYQLQAQQQFVQTQESTAIQEYTDPSDGTVYEWDSVKRGWFPKIDGNFLATYHSNYGYYKPEESSATSSATVQSVEANSGKNLPGAGTGVSGSGSGEDEGPPEAKKKKQPTTPGWFDIDNQHNTNVYVSGLHYETTPEEFIELMSKCGIIMNDDQGQPKIKLYHDGDGYFKGDALCCYLKVESVDLAIQLIDESEFKGQTVHVERAKFQMKGNYNPSLKKKKKPSKKKKGNVQERLLDWKEKRSGPSRSKFDRIVIFKHLFDPDEFETDPMLINEIKDDLREECEKLGEVKKILIFDRNEDGVASVAFKDFEAADQCISAMNGRFYGGKKLEVFNWDGVTNYEIEETEQERKKRVEKWATFLEGGGEGGNNCKKADDSATAAGTTTTTTTIVSTSSDSTTGTVSTTQDSSEQTVDKLSSQ